jgi:hypothetical protein
MKLEFYQIVLIIGFVSVIVGVILIIVDISRLQYVKQKNENLVKKVVHNSREITGIPDDTKEELAKIIGKVNTRLPQDQLVQFLSIAENTMNVNDSGKEKAA